MTFSKELDDLLRKYVSFCAKEIMGEESSYTYVGSETIGEVIEKLLILNIRIWVLEDIAAKAKLDQDDGLYVDIKKKLDVCFKIKRPLLVNALNTMFSALHDGKNNVFFEDSNIKLYQHEK